MKVPVIIIGCGNTPTEYFCCRCRQLRLDCRKDRTACSLCGNKDIITGSCGSLDKAVLIRKLDGYKE